MIDLEEYAPCSEHCPAVTGKPYGSVKYCPMQSEENWKQHREKEDTDCCANFQCCVDLFEKAGLVSIMDNLVEGVPLFGVTKDGKVLK